MKKITIIFLLLLAVKSWSQGDKKIWLQNNKYILGHSYFQKKQFNRALEPLLFAYKINPESEIGKMSKNNIDSLKPIIRENFVNKITGMWNLMGDNPLWVRKDLKSSKPNDTFMVITNQEIAYYARNIKTKEIQLIKTDKIIFYDGFENNDSVIEMINSDNELWTFIIDESSKSLRIIQSGVLTTTGREKIDIDNKEAFYSRMK